MFAGAATLTCDLLGIRGSTSTTTVNVVGDLVDLFAVLVYDGGVASSTGVSSEHDPILKTQSEPSCEEPFEGWVWSSFGRTLYTQPTMVVPVL